jgi:enamine deaminase RidA (YjgF/YER057c/UK114 family)/GNAT superfamily N-acetyltransferase
MLPGVRVNVTTWSLEITNEADLRPSAPPPEGVEIRRALHPSPELGRFLYTAAGGNWYWIMRLGWSYERWLERLSHPRVEMWVMYLEGTPAAYFELDGSIENQVEVAYMGVLPAFLGRGLGGPLLTAAIRRGWAMGAERVWVHTCTLDSPRALAHYQARGMRVLKEETEPLELPDVLPGAWPGAGVHGPHISIPLDAIIQEDVMSKVEERLAKLGHKVPEPGKPMFNYVGAVKTGNLVFVSGHGPRSEDGEYVYRGKVGQDIDVETARKAAELVILNCLGSLKQVIGDLDRVTRVVKLLGMVNSAPDFEDQPKVINAASDILVEAFGDAGKHARSAVGMSSLPFQISVEIEMIVEVRD